MVGRGSSRAIDMSIRTILKANPKALADGSSAEDTRLKAGAVGTTVGRRDECRCFSSPESGVGLVGKPPG
jgi:hypothetical protein